MDVQTWIGLIVNQISWSLDHSRFYLFYLYLHFFLGLLFDGHFVTDITEVRYRDTVF